MHKFTTLKQLKLIKHGKQMVKQMDLAIYFGGLLGILALHNDNKPTTIHR